MTQTACTLTGQEATTRSLHCGQAGMQAWSCRSSNYSKEIGNTYFYVKSSLGSLLKAKLKPNASAANRELFVP